MRRRAALLIVFGYAVLLFELLRVGLAWWQGEIAEPGWPEYALLAALPLSLLALWRIARPPRQRPPGD
jgi:hypothetical protein